MNDQKRGPLNSALHTEKLLAGIHRQLASEMGEAEFRGHRDLHSALETALWHLGVAVLEAAAVTTGTRESLDSDVRIC